MTSEIALLDARGNKTIKRKIVCCASSLRKMLFLPTNLKEQNIGLLGPQNVISNDFNQIAESVEVVEVIN